MNKLTNLKPFFLKHSKLIAILVFFFGSSSAAIYSLIQEKYIIDQKIAYPYQIAPSSSKFYLELNDLKAARDFWVDSKIYRELPPSARDSAFFSLRTFTYFLQIKAGIPLNSEQIFSFFSGPTGFGYDQNNQRYAITKVNQASQFGIAFAAAMSGTSVDIPQSPVKKKKDKAINSDTYQRSFPANTLPLNNLKGFKITFQQQPLYFALLSNYLIVAEDLDLLSTLLRNASTENNGVLQNYQELKDKKQEGLGFITWSNQLLLGLAFGAESGAGLISADKESLNITFKVSSSMTDGDVLQEKDLKAVSTNSVMGLLNGNGNYNHILKLLKDGNSKQAQYLYQFLDGLGLSLEANDSPVAALLLDELTLDAKKKQITPQFSLRLAGVKTDEMVKKTFNRAESKQVQLAETDFNVYPSTGSQRYSLYTGVNKGLNSQWLYSSESSLLNHLNASRGMAPVLSDLLSALNDGSLQKPESFFFINGNQFLSNLEAFYTYGALKSPHYSQVTIDKEIKPVLDALKKDYYLVVAVQKDKGTLKLFQKAQ